MRLDRFSSLDLRLGASGVVLGAVLVSAGALTGCASTPHAGEMATASGSNIPAAPQIDRSKCSDKGKEIVTGDTNLDKKPDVWKFFETTTQNGQKVQVLTCKTVDLNHDGRLDAVYYYDDRGDKTTLEEFDLDFDGKFDMTVYYVNGKKVRVEKDLNFDGRADDFMYYEDGKLVREEVDTNGDGKIDQWLYYEGGKIDRIGYDTQGTGRVDKWDRAPEQDETGPAEGAAAPAKGPAPATTPPPPATTTPPAAAATTPPAAPAKAPAPAPKK